MNVKKFKLVSILLLALAAMLCFILPVYAIKKTNTSNMKKLPQIDNLWDFSNPAATETKFRELLPASKVQDASYHAELLTQIARTQSLQRQFDDAHNTLDAAKLIISDEMFVPKIRYYLERGRTYNTSGMKEKATEQFQLALSIAVENGQDYYAVDAAHMLGISEKADKQLQWNLKAIEMAENSSDPKTKKWLGSLYNNTGWSYHDMESYDEALIYFKKALNLYEAQKNLQAVFIAKWTIGRTYRSLERFEDALEIQMSLLKEIETGKAKADGYVYEEIGECLLVKSGREASKPYFAKAYDLLKDHSWLSEKRLERLRSFK